MTSFLELARDRYSVRAFSDAPVEAEKVEALVDAAIAAPTAVDRQPWHLWVVEDPDAVARLSALTRFSFGARVILMLGAAPDEAWVRKYDGRNFADVDASIVGTTSCSRHTTWASAPRGSATSTRPRSTRRFRRPRGTTSWRSSRLAIPPTGAEPAAKHFERRGASELVTRV